MRPDREHPTGSAAAVSIEPAGNVKGQFDRDQTGSKSAEFRRHMDERDGQAGSGVDRKRQAGRRRVAREQTTIGREVF